MSIMGGLLIGGIAYTFAKTEESMKIDAQAQKKYARAYEKQAEAVELVRRKQELVDDTLMKLVNRKRAILATSMNSFLKLYEKIIKINFVDGDGVKELNKSNLTSVDVNAIRRMTVTAISPMSEKELIGSFLLKGIGGVMVDDSKRNLARANSQVKISNVIYSQAETMAVALDAVISESEKIAVLLAKMNLLFTQSINISSSIIESNGENRNNYSIQDRKVLMTCINIADAVKKVIDTPILNEEGIITKEAILALQIGNEFLEKIGKI